MTVTSNTTRNDYVAGTNQNVYNYTFQLNEASDVTVYLGGVVQTLNTHYTVQNVGVGTGGTITFTLVDGSNNPIFPYRWDSHIYCHGYGLRPGYRLPSQWCILSG